MMSDKCPKCESVQWHPCWFDGMFQCSNCKYSEPLSGTFARLRNQLAQKEAELVRLMALRNKHYKYIGKLMTERNAGRAEIIQQAATIERLQAIVRGQRPRAYIERKMQ